MLSGLMTEPGGAEVGSDRPTTVRTLVRAGKPGARLWPAAAVRGVPGQLTDRSIAAAALCFGV